MLILKSEALLSESQTEISPAVDRVCDASEDPFGNLEPVVLMEMHHQSKSRVMQV